MQTELNIENEPDEACATGFMPDPIDAEDAARIAHVLAALADPIRLELVSIIARAKNSEICACSFVEDLHRSQPTISHHLKTLTSVGICKGERRGRWVWYSLNYETIQSIFGELASVLNLEFPITQIQHT